MWNSFTASSKKWTSQKNTQFLEGWSCAAVQAGMVFILKWYALHAIWSCMSSTSSLTIHINIWHAFSVCTTMLSPASSLIHCSLHSDIQLPHFYVFGFFFFFEKYGWKPWRCFLSAMFFFAWSLFNLALLVCCDGRKGHRTVIPKKYYYYLLFITALPPWL